MSLHALRRREGKPSLRTVRPQPDTQTQDHIRETASLKIGASVRRPTALRFPVGAETKAFYKRFYPDTSATDWNDWRWQMRVRIRTLAELSRIFRLSEDERSAVERHEGALPVGITPYYASLMGLEDAREPLRRTHIMTGDEYIKLPGEDDDPLGEDHDTVAPGLVHRYPDRVLFLTTGTCSTYCRYCTRARVVGNPGGEYQFSTRQWEQALAYLEVHTEVRDVLLSGGDPLTLGDDKLDWLLTRLRAIKHIEFIRIGSKMPTVTPQRITKSLVAILKKHHPLWMSLHFTHPNELTPETTEATARLADAGIPLGSQTVLLKGINDDAEIIKPLMHGLLKRRVKPYYLFQCDPIRGSGHFRTNVEKGLEIIQALRGHTTGYATPIFCVDAPGGGGKMQLAPDPVVGRDGDDLLLRNFEGNVYRYPDPGGELGRNKGGMMRIGVTYDLRADYLAMGMSEEDTAEFDSEVTIVAICSALSGLGLTPVRIGTVNNLIAKLAKGERFDAVFNFCEGLKGIAREAQVPAILDIYDIPYVFSDPLTMALTLDKGMCKRVVRDAGVPTVDFRVIEKLSDVKKVDLAFPLFLKPVREGSGKGVGADSKVENARDLRRVAGNLLAKFNQPVLVEEFLPGREFTVGILGTGDDATVLGVSEIVPIGNWVGDGYGYENKEYSDDKVSIVEADEESSKAAGEVALAAWRALRCRDSGRIDVRCDANNKPHFIEVNPIAGLRPDYSDLCLIASRKGLSHPQLIGKIMAAFFKRHPELKVKPRPRVVAA